MERDQAIKFVHELLRKLVEVKGSDLFLTAGFPPAIKVDGRVKARLSGPSGDVREPTWGPFIK